MNPITTGLLGLSVADAIGVPVEFNSRDELDQNPVTDIRGYGTYNQPPGYFSDDSSLAFGLAESLATGDFDLLDQARRLLRYKHEGYWTPAGQLFDIGITTSRAIDRLLPLVTAGRTEELRHLRAAATEFDNGNGALMRIFPLYAFLRSRPLGDWLPHIWEHSALTHGHLRSALCCFLYLRLCHHLVAGKSRVAALDRAREELKHLFDQTEVPAAEREELSVLLGADFATLARAQVQGNGYVVRSLEAALWALFRGSDYRSVVLAAVNLGEDTDTTACIAGAPAALCFGAADIPDNWLAALARREDITALGDRLHRTYSH
ncbi:ADP-ribosylglycohydrolase family protein [Lewinella sp. W8]|uniref:ADP-ribosylglycohydrolase family protein n=1 Tax=Lewinella sp. W8 TaxID=2528208 RepID=UPI00106751F3|nr:ADP-ribosylglycohydrolase family protein [Lewinella sp. W8]MTB51939.1 crystallin J1 [Lewinella sp. W8]